MDEDYLPEKGSSIIGYRSRKRLNVVQNSKGLNLECTVEMTDVDNEAAVREAKDLFRRFKEAMRSE